MVKDKYDFIKQLLETEKLSPTQKERVLLLSAKEISDNTGLEARVSKIEEIVFREERVIEQKIILHKTDKKKSCPQETYNLLNKFSSTEGGIKNLTHSFNATYIEYDKFITECRKEFDEGKKEFPNVPASLLKRIEEFAFSTNPDWYIRKGKEKKKINLGWGEQEFINWYKISQQHPASNAKYNKEMIIPFKESIQVRADTGNLIKLIFGLQRLVFGENSSINLTIEESVKSAQFYTDVDSLGQAIFHIFEIIKHISSLNFCDEVQIDYNSENDFKILSIIHIDSETKKKAHDADFMGADLKSIQSNLWGLCNFDVIAKFPDGCFRKVILTDNKDETVKNSKYDKWEGRNFPFEEAKIKGFTYSLKFY